MRTLLKLDSVRFSRRGEAWFSFLSNSMQAREYASALPTGGPKAS
jgi:hypothetical protein